MYIRQIFLIQMEYRLQSLYDYMVGRTVSVISPFYSILPVIKPHGFKNCLPFQGVVFKILEYSELE